MFKESAYWNKGIFCLEYLFEPYIFDIFIFHLKHNENQNEDTDTEEAKGTSEKRVINYFIIFNYFL